MKISDIFCLSAKVAFVVIVIHLLTQILSVAILEFKLNEMGSVFVVLHYLLTFFNYICSFLHPIIVIILTIVICLKFLNNKTLKFMDYVILIILYVLITTIFITIIDLFTLIYTNIYQGNVFYLIVALSFVMFISLLQEFLSFTTGIILFVLYKEIKKDGFSFGGNVILQDKTKDVIKSSDDW